jgi:hypothetical protein
MRVAVGAASLCVMAGLTGCVQSVTPAQTATPTVSAPASASPTASATPTAAPTTQKFTESCSTLLTAQEVFAYNPNYVADTNYAPKAGTVAAAIAAAAGQTCGWINETSSVELEVAVAKPVPSTLASAKSAASTGTPISASGEQGYFAVKNGVGSAQFFFGTLWLDVSSQDFTVAGDAQPVYSVVVHNQLTAGG